MLRKGADVLGDLKCSGIGTPLVTEASKPAEELWHNMSSRNTALLNELREDTLSEKLMELTLADARLGRMSMPKQVDPSCLQECLMCPRFGVEQLKQDGRTKVRAVDNFSWAPSLGSKAEKKQDSVNGALQQRASLVLVLALYHLCAVRARSRI